MIDCDKSIEGKNLKRVVKRKKSVKRERIGRKGEIDRRVKTFL